METEPVLVYKLANSFARMTLEAYKDELGENGLNALINFAELYQFINNLPFNNLEQEVTFNDYSAIHNALVSIYGDRTANNISYRAGHRMYTSELHRYGALGGLSSEEFQVLNIEERVELGLHALVKIINYLSNQDAALQKDGDRWFIIVNHCPVCWGLATSIPICDLTRGLIKANLTEAVKEKTFMVEQDQSCSTGDAVCRFVIFYNVND